MRAAPVLALALLAAPAWAVAKEISLPADDYFLQQNSLQGYPLASGYCSTCHSADYIKYQPYEPRAFWQAEVTKMIKVYGAPIPDSAVNPIVDYLVKTYGAEGEGARRKRAS